jgi:hypothetical protein
MRTRIIPAASAALLVLAAALALVSCPASIYFTLEGEKKTIDNTLNNFISFFDVASLGGAYYAAGGSIWKGTVSGTTSTWDTTKITPPQPGMLCNGLVAFGGNLYGSFFAPSGPAVYGLFQNAGGGASFAAISLGTPADVQGKQISLVRVIPSAAGGLAIVTAVPSGNSFLYTLYDSPDGPWPNGGFVPVLSGKPNPISGVAYAASRYWAVTGQELYSDVLTPGTMNSVGVGSTIGSSDELRDVFADGNTLIVTSKLGAVYYCPNAAAPLWTKVTAAKVGDKTVGFLGISKPVDAAGDRYLVGADGYGYYTLDVSATPTLTRFDVSTIALYASAVRGFFVDGSTVFAQTLARGLWRANFTTAGVPDSDGWIQE